VATKQESYLPDLRKLLNEALKKGKAAALENYLTENSGLPGTRMNLAVVNAMADVVGEIITQPDLPEEALEDLMDRWAALSAEEAATNDPREILPAAAVMSYGQAAVSRPDWWADELAKIHKAASDPRWRMHEMVAAALQRMLDADWNRAFMEISDWLRTEDPLVVRAAAAAVGEPGLLKDESRGMNALALQAEAIGWLLRVPADRRKDDDVRTLRKALGYTLSVTIAAVPDMGLTLLGKLASLNDTDIRWNIRENLKKSRMKPFAEKIEAMQAMLE